MMQRLLLLLIVVYMIPANTQVPDTTTAAIDSSRTDTTVVATPNLTSPSAPPRSSAPDSVVAFYRDVRGKPIPPAEPARSPALHLSEWLMDLPHGFLHSFRTPGWPDGWSPMGFDPATVHIRLNGIDHVNLMTGRSALEMMPVGVMDQARVATGVGGAPIGIVLNTQTMDQARPITGLRYQTDNIGLQHVEASHAQRRLATIFGRRGELNLTAVYMGRGATGEYPGSSLKRERALMGRARFARPTWSFQISNLYGRHRVGAHGGVVPWSGGTYETIYYRTDAVVRNNGALRFTIRNDLDARLRLLRGGATSDIAAFRTTESFRYLHGSETTQARIHRTGLMAAHSASIGSHHLQIQSEGWFESVENDSALTHRRDHRRYAVELRVQDSLDVGGFSIQGEAGFRYFDSGSGAMAQARLERSSRMSSAFLDLSLTWIDIPTIAIKGFGPHVTPLENIRPGRAFMARTGVAVTPGSLRLEVDAYAVREQHRLMSLMDVDHLLRFDQLVDPVDRIGLSFRSAYRADATHGLYIDLRANTIHWSNRVLPMAIAPLADSQPRFWGSGRLGARMLLFQGDLDADLYIRGFMWSGMRGRRMHPMTGLLSSPAASDRWFHPNGLLDVILEAQVRTATITVGFENVLSGTEITLGNLLVPDYPLPERRFRIGVFWPILD